MRPEPNTPAPAPEPTTTAPDNNNGGNNGDNGDVHTGGVATWYQQDSNEAACGGIYQDGDMIGAMNQNRYGDVSGRASFCIFAFS